MVEEVIETEEEPVGEEALDEEFDKLLDETLKDELEEEVKEEDKETDDEEPEKDNEEEPSEEDERAEIETLEAKDELDEDEQKRFDELKEKYPEEKTDEDEERGKEIIKEEEERRKEDEEAERKAEEDKAEADRKKAASNVPSLSKDDAKAFLEYIPDGRIPDTLTVGDVELDLKGYMDDNAEALIVNTAQTQEYIIKLVNAGVLMTNKDFQGKLEDVQNDYDDKLFGLSVMVELQNLGHAGHNLDKLIGSDKFDDWGKGQDDKTKALFRSDARDYARGVQKYLNDAGLKKAKETSKEIDDKAAEDKKKHDAIHKNTKKKSKPTQEISADETAEYEDEIDKANRDLEKQP